MKPNFTLIQYKSYYKFLVIFIFSIAYTSIQAQITQIIRGKVIDKESKSELIGANVIILNTEPVKGTVSDLNGNFSLQSTIGRLSLKITFVGYEDLIIPAIEVISGKETYLTIELTEKLSAINEVQVVGNKNKAETINSMASISARMISTEDANRYAAGYSDPARLVSSFAGVAPAEGDKNNIIIRGNSPRGLLWRLEGIEIPSPNHFSDGQGDAGGSFCMINSNLMANSDFFTGAFPAEYGNALAGIMDLNLRKGNANTREHAIQIGIVGTELTTEGPLTKNGGSYLLSYRYSNFKSLQKMGLLDLGVTHLTPKFQDLAFNVNLPAGKLGTYSLFGILGESTTGKQGVLDSVLWQKDDEYTDNELEVHKTGIVGLKNALPFENRKTYLKTIVAFTDQFDKWDMGFIINRQYPWFKGTLVNNYAEFREKYNTFEYPTLHLTSVLNHKFNSMHTLRAGFVYNLLGFKMYAEEYNYDRSVTLNNPVYDVLVNHNSQTSFYQAFVQWKYRLSEKVELNSGLHGLYFVLNNHYAIEPRLGLKWQINPKYTINYGFGIHSRIESIASYYTYVFNPDGSSYLPNKDINFTRSIHNVLGFDWLIAPEIRFKSEIYHQYLYDIPIKNNPNSTESAINAAYGLPDTAYSNMGLGKNYGIELTLEKFFSHNYYFLVTASIFESKYKAGDGNWYNTVYNSNYVTNWLIGKDFYFGESKKNVFGMNFKVFVKGGLRYTPINWNASGDDPVYITSLSYTKQAPDILRFDMGLKYRRNNSRYSWIISLDIQNLTNRKNVLAYDYRNDTNNKWLEAIEGLPLIPILNFRVEF